MTQAAKKIRPTDYPRPDVSLPVERQNLVTLLAMAVWGEARGEEMPGKIAVANVIRNRVLAGIYGGSTFRQVILAPLQFSCFNRNDSNRALLLHPLRHSAAKVWADCYDVAKFILDGDPAVQDNTDRATHYFSPRGMRPPGSMPGWAIHFKFTVAIGRHRFYRDPKAYRIERTTDSVDYTEGEKPLLSKSKK